METRRRARNDGTARLRKVVLASRDIDTMSCRSRANSKIKTGESGIYPSVSWAIKSAIDPATAGSIRAATGGATAIDRSRSAEMWYRERRRRDRDLEVEEDTIGRSEPQRKQRVRVEEQTIFELSRNKISDEFASES